MRADGSSSRATAINVALSSCHRSIISEPATSRPGTMDASVLTPPAMSAAASRAKASASWIASSAR
jgi:hypothetical protein